MATVTLSNSGTTTYPIKMRVTYTENGSGITITKVEGCRTDTTRTYDTSGVLLVNGSSLVKGVDFPANSAWKSMWSGSKVLSTYTATFTFTSNVASIKNSKFVLSVTATTYKITYTKGTGVSSFTGPATVNHGATVTTKATASTGYYLDHYTKTVGTTTSTATDCKGEKTHTRVFAAVTANTTFGCYASPYTCKVTFHKNHTGTTAAYSETYTAGKGQKFGKDISATGGQFGDWDRTGYTLKGWATSSSVTTAAYGVYATVSDSFIETNKDGIDLYAVWEVKKYTITYIAEDGVKSFTGPTSVAYGSTFDTTAVANTGYHLTKYMRLDSGDTEYTSSTECSGKSSHTKTFSAVTGNAIVRVYAEINTYTITYAKDTGVSTFTGKTSVTHGSDVDTTATAATGYYLTKYIRKNLSTNEESTSTDCSGKKSYSATFHTIVANTKLAVYADPYTCKVTFHKNTGGTATYSETYTAGKSGNQFGMNLSIIGGQFGDWDRTGYTLKGWSASASATSATYGIYSSVSNSFIENNHSGIDLYAVWEVNKYTVTYKKHTGVKSFTGPTSVAYGSTFTTIAEAETGYVLSEYRRQNASDSAYTSATDCAGESKHTRTFAAVTENVTVAAYATPYVYIKINGAWKAGVPYIKKGGKWSIGDAFIKKNNSWQK